MAHFYISLNTSIFEIAYNRISLIAIRLKKRWFDFLKSLYTIQNSKIHKLLNCDCFSPKKVPILDV